jgi:hypothetical protein
MLLTFGSGLPQTDRGASPAGVGQAAALAARIIAIDIRLDKACPLKMLEHSLDKLRGGTQPGSQHACLERATITDLCYQSFKHI